MKADLSRVTFDPRRPTARVVRQQGRPDTDADLNEQFEAGCFTTRALAADLLGWHGTFGAGCHVTVAVDTVRNPGGPDRVTWSAVLGRGTYYVDGLSAVVDAETRTVLASEVPAPSSEWVVLLDVWERYFAPGEPDQPAADPAFGGVDTCGRVRVVHRLVPVRVRPFGDGTNPKDYFSRDQLHKLIRDYHPEEKDFPLMSWRPRPTATIAVAAPDRPTDPCGAFRADVPPGFENQTYRVEVHRRSADRVTLKWSIDNASVGCAAKVVSVDPESGRAEVEIGRRAARRFARTRGRWAELVVDGGPEHGGASALLRVADAWDVTIVLENPKRSDHTKSFLEGIGPVADATGKPQPRTVFLRLWDHSGRPEDLDDGAVICESGVAVPLTPGLTFTLVAANFAQTGDYWLAVTRRGVAYPIDWPPDNAGAVAPQEARRVEHHYAPLALISVEGTNPKVNQAHGRRQFAPLPFLTGSREDAAKSLMKDLTARVDLTASFRALMPKYRGDLPTDALVPTVFAEISIQPEELKGIDLSDPDFTELKNALTKNPYSIGEMRLMNEAQFLDSLGKANEKLVVSAKVREKVTAIFGEALGVCLLLDDWPSEGFTKEELDQLLA